MASKIETRCVPIEDLGLPLSNRALQRVARHVWQRGTAPPRIYLRGRLPEQTGIAVVGTRRASPEARAFTRALCTDLAAAGFSIWSGGAVGIDYEAHDAALAAGAPTVLVAPTGLDHPYPAEHAQLYDRAAAMGGGLLSLWPDEIKPATQRFLQRNRLLAALTAATVVIQAPIRSGARSTAAAARALGRPLCVVPHPPWCTRGAGCLGELIDGARPIRSARDVIGALQLMLQLPGPAEARHGGASGPRRRPGAKKTPSSRTAAESQAARPRAPLAPGAAHCIENQTLSAAEETVLGALGAEPQHVDAVCEATGLPVSEVGRALLTLTLRSEVVEGPAGHYRCGGACGRQG